MRMAIGALAGAACLGLGAPAMAGAHTWNVSEVFSNADGTIQFIELTCPTAAEIFLAGLNVSSNTNNFFFPSNLVGPTTNKSILLATAGFALLPGAPTPDHIIVDNFFSTAGDKIRYYLYDCATFTVSPAGCPVGSSSTAGVLPTDGCLSLSRFGGSLVSGTNTPRNYAGATGTVSVKPLAEDTNGDGAVNVLDLIELLLCFGQPGTGSCAEEDIDGSGTVNVLDLIELLLAFGTSGFAPCP